MLMNIQEIMKYLPHRYPFLLIDKVIEFDEQNIILTQKNVSVNEPFFQGHFPHYMVMPGVLIIEAMAQTSAIFAYQKFKIKNDSANVYFFVGIDKARFKKPVIPGDILIISSKIVRNVKGIWKFYCEAKVENIVVSHAELLCTMKKI